jgi:hypothetical protein
MPVTGIVWMLITLGWIDVGFVTNGIFTSYIWFLAEGLDEFPLGTLSFSVGMRFSL